MIKKMTGRGAITATALSNETGVSQATLSRWKREASSVFEVPKDKPTERPEPKRAQDWNPEEKLRAVVETGGLSEPELGSYLRRHGLHSEQLESWRADCYRPI